MTIRKSINRGATSRSTDRWREALLASGDGDADPLSAAEVEAMRRTVVDAARDVPPERTWRPLLAIAAALLVMIGAGSAAGRWLVVNAPAAPPAAPQMPAATS